MATPSRPPRQVCPLCATDDEVELRSDGPDLWTFVCNNPHPTASFEWSPTPVVSSGSGQSGLAAELGLYDALLRSIGRGEWVEYGVVEYRIAKEEPSAYRTLLDIYGHASLGPTRYSTSSFISHTLAQLQKEGLLIVDWTKATGYWSYLSRVSAWALPGTPSGQILTWVDLAASLDVDPSTWPPTE